MAAAPSYRARTAGARQRPQALAWLVVRRQHRRCGPGRCGRRRPGHGLADRHGLAHGPAGTVRRRLVAGHRLRHGRRLGGRKRGMTMNESPIGDAPRTTHLRRWLWASALLNLFLVGGIAGGTWRWWAHQAEARSVATSTQTGTPTGAPAGSSPATARGLRFAADGRSEEHTSELQSPCNLVCRLLLEKKKN